MRGFSVQKKTITKTEEKYTCKAKGCGATFTSKLEAEHHWAHFHAAKKKVGVGSFRLDYYYYFELESDAQLWLKHVYRARLGFPGFRWKGPGFYCPNHSALNGSTLDHIDVIIERKSDRVREIEQEIADLQKRLSTHG